MKLFRLCSEDEIDVIKTNSKDRVYFGSPLYRYMDCLTRRDLNYYPTFENMWEEYVETGSIKPVLKTFKDIPKCINLQTSNWSEKQEIMKKFYYVHDRPQMPQIVEDMMKNKIDDFVFVVSIKVAGYFDNPIKPYVFWQDAYSGLQNQILEIEFDDKLATFYSGTGNYLTYSMPNFTMREYALPMYMLKKENIVNVYEFGSDKEKQMRKDWVEKFLNDGRVMLNDGDNAEKEK